MTSTAAPLLAGRSRSPGRQLMRLTFTRTDDGRSCVALASPPGRRAFRLSVMPIGRDLPHDLATAAVEASYACAEGFLNLTAHGATFRSGDRRRTQPGRGLVRAHAAGLAIAEGLVHDAIESWRAGRGGLAAPLLDEHLIAWRAVAPGGTLAYDWAVLPLPRPMSHRR